jgi:hypothetical protein
MKRVVQPVAETAAPVVESVTETAQPVVESATETAHPVLEAATRTARPLMHPLVEIVQPVVQPVAETAQPIVESATKAAQPVLAAAARTAQPLVEVATQTAQPVLHRVTETLGPVVRTVQQTAQPVSELLRPVQPLVQTVPLPPSVQLLVQTVIQAAEPVVWTATPAAEPLIGAPTQAVERVALTAAEPVIQTTGSASAANRRVAVHDESFSAQAPGAPRLAERPASFTAPAESLAEASRDAAPGSLERASDAITVTTEAVRRGAKSQVPSALDATFPPSAAAALSRGAPDFDLGAAGADEVSDAAGSQPGSSDDPSPFPVLSPGSAAGSPAPQLEVFAAAARGSPPAALMLGSRLPSAPNLLRSPLLAFPLERPG